MAYWISQQSNDAQDHRRQNAGQLSQYSRQILEEEVTS
jgi:hypothetical protein